MKMDLIAVDLRLALREPGCPICRLLAKAEHGYLWHLLYENVNDLTTRMQIIASLGFCPAHVWQMGRIESDQFGDAVGNSIIYEHLAEVTYRRIERYFGRARLQAQHRRCRGWIDRLLRRDSPPALPVELRPQVTCRVCQMRDDNERTHLHWLLRGLSQPDPVRGPGEEDGGNLRDARFREWYTASDRLCLPHLRLSLELADHDTEAGARFLAEDALHHVAQLHGDLGEFIRKHSWQYRHEGLTEGERNSWRRALTFFGGNERTENGRRSG